MQWIPTLGWGLLHGWLFFLFYLVVFGLTLRTCQKDVRRRLYDRSLWTTKTRVITAVGKLFSLANIVLIFLGELTLGTPEFVVGTVIYAFGLSVLVVAIFNYRDAPLDAPITKGIYKISQNPQMVAIYVLFVGMALVVGSGLGLILLAVSATCTHFSILGEEHALQAQYGESYAAYKEQVPRYLVFF